MKEKKKSKGQINHDLAMKIDRDISNDCDPAIRRGVLLIHESVTHRHVLTGPHSIEKLIRLNVDKPIKEWLKKYSDAQFSFSKKLVDEGMRFTIFFDQLYQTFEREHGWTTDLIYKDLAATCNALINLASFCCNHGGENEMAIRIESEAEAGKPSQTIIETSREKKLPQPRLKSVVSFPKNMSDARLCELCHNLSEHSYELLRIKNSYEKPMISHKARALILKNPDARIVILGFSRRFCSQHSRNQNQDGHKHGSDLRDTYDAMRRVIIWARQAKRLSVEPSDILRAAAFLIVDHCPSKELIQVIPKMAEDWLLCNQKNENHKIHFFEHLQKIAIAFQTSNHRLAKFISAVAQLPSKQIILIAYELGIHSEERERLIENGFIKNGIFMLSNEGQRIWQLIDSGEELRASVPPTAPAP